MKSPPNVSGGKGKVAPEGGGHFEAELAVGWAKRFQQQLTALLVYKTGWFHYKFANRRKLSCFIWLSSVFLFSFYYLKAEANPSLPVRKYLKILAVRVAARNLRSTLLRLCGAPLLFMASSSLTTATNTHLAGTNET